MLSFPCFHSHVVLLSFSCFIPMFSSSILSFPQSQWASLQSKVDARSKLVDNLLYKLTEFNRCYGQLKEFVGEGHRLLGDEKPVGESASRLQEQVETCQVLILTFVFDMAHTHTHTHTHTAIPFPTGCQATRSRLPLGSRKRNSCRAPNQHRQRRPRNPFDRFHTGLVGPAAGLAELV